MSEKLMDLMSLLEANLDLSEEGIDLVDRDRIAGEIFAHAAALDALINHARRSAEFCRPLRVALVGRPNAGKSSLLNSLLGSARAIVSPEPGTTRDVIEARVDWESIPFELVDTAGLRESADAVESEGVSRSRAAARGADVIAWVVDSTRLAEQIGDYPEILRGDIPCVVAVNKTDVQPADARVLGAAKSNGLGAAVIVRTSAVKPGGAEDLRSALVAQGRMRLEDLGDGPIWVSARQLEILLAAAESLARGARAALNPEVSEEFIAADVREAVEALESFSGRRVGQDVLDRIFSSFCVGK